MSDNEDKPSQSIERNSSHTDPQPDMPRKRSHTPSDEDHHPLTARDIETPTNVNTDIKKAFRDHNAEKSRALHEKKVELARRRKMKNNNKNDLGEAPSSTKNLLPQNSTNSDEMNRGVNETEIEIETGSEVHKSHGDKVKSIIYGGLDGIITTFAVVAGVRGADLDVEVILVLGFANLVADGLSMGVGDFLSEKAEHDFAESERSREKWEFDNYKEGEIQEMIEIYESKGISKEDATIILRRMAKYPDFFIDHMMIQELDIHPPDEDASPMRNGLITLFSFLVFGCVPLLAYLIFENVDFGDDYDPKFLISIILTLITLAVLGGVKVK